MGHHTLTDKGGTVSRSFTIEYIATDPVLPEGFYWVPCFPMPAHEHGPFKTYETARQSAIGALHAS